MEEREAESGPGSQRRRRAAPLYVEIRIAAPLEELWAATQDPARHQEWDLRFSRIEYLPRASTAEPQRFRYATRIGLGLAIEGRGESTGTQEKDGRRSSALRFWSDDPRSLIRAGSGYWKYVPEEQGVRFLTRYDYDTRFGVAGAWFDRWVFRPLIGWATAWSFDLLRLSLEGGGAPRALLASAGAQATARLAQAGVWLYQGLVPKLLWQETGELEILRGSGLFGGHEPGVLSAIGAGELAFGLLLLLRPRSRALPWIEMGLLLLLLLGAVVSRPATLVAPFNPPSLTLALLGLAAAELWLLRLELPSASRCRRQPPVTTTTATPAPGTP